MNSKDINLNVGDCFSVKTYSRFSMGYVPQIEINNIKLEVLDDYLQPVIDSNYLVFKYENNQTTLIDRNTNVMMGGSSELNFNFKALEKGKGTICITHYRPWAEDEDKIVEKYYITIV